MSDPLFDSGLQPERTHLAWQRTIVALAVGCALSARLFAPSLGAASVVTALGGLAVAVIAYLMLWARYTTVIESLRRHRTLILVGALPQFLLALTATLLGVLAVLFVAHAAVNLVG